MENNSSLEVATNQTTVSISTTEKTVLSSFYYYLSTAGFVPLVVILVGIRVLIGTVGIVLNFNLVWLTVRNRNLRGPCNILIALFSGALAIYALGFFPMWLIVLSGQNLVRLQPCFWVMAWPVFSKNFSLIMMVAIGLDRFKSIIFPWLSERAELCFVLFWTWLSSAFGFWVIGLSYIVVRRMPEDTPVMCAGSEISQKEAANLAFNSALYLNYASPAVYCILGIFVYLKAPNDTGRQRNRRLFKSIFVLMLIEMIGWGTNSISVLFFGKFFAIATMSDLTKWAINCVFSYLQILAITANAPALYFCSSEYRKAFLSQFGWKKNSTKTQVVPLTNTNLVVSRLQQTY